MTEDTSIIIDLAYSSQATPMKPGGFLHKNALKFFNATTKRILSQISKFRDQLDHSGNVVWAYSRMHDTILIHGRRGAGKSTFLLTAMEAIASGKACDEIGDKNVVSLGIVDPTLMGGKEHLLLIILQRIMKLVDSTHASRSCNPSDGKCEYKDIKNQLMKIGKGLQTIGELSPEGNSTEIDPQIWLEDRLERARHGGDLEREFHRFVDQCLRFIKKDAFMIGLDDIDTKFEIGWPVLETVRKYLTTPQLVVVLSGDIELYELLVRKQQMSTIGLSLESSDDRLGSYRRIIRDLTDQYLLKLLDAKNRIHIPLLEDYTKLYEIRIIDSIFKDVEDHYDDLGRIKGSPGKPLGEVLDMFLTYMLGTIRHDHREMIKATITSQTTRSVIRLLTVYSRNSDRNWMLETSHTRDPQEAFVELEGIMAPHLLRFGYGLHEAMEIGQSHSYGKFLECLQKNDLLSAGGHRMLPEFYLDWQNLSLMTLSAVFQNKARHDPIVIVDYWIKACLPQQISKDGFHSFNNLIMFTNLHSRDSALKTSQRILGFLSDKPYMQFSGKINGTIKLSDDEVTLLSEQSKKSDFHLKSLLVSRVVDTMGDESYYSSIYSILGFFAELVICDNDEKEILLLLKEGCIQKTYPKYNVNDDNGDLHQSSSGEQDLKEVQTIGSYNSHAPSKAKRISQPTKGVKAFAKTIAKWKEENSPASLAPGAAIVNTSVSPERLSSIFYRFHYAISVLEQKKPMSPWQMASQWVLNFLYSVMIEDLLFIRNSGGYTEQYSYSSSYENPIFSDQLFKDLLGNETAMELLFDKERRTVSHFICRCPIWLIFMDSGSIREDVVKAFRMKHTKSFTDWLSKNSLGQSSEASS